jgi:hypothetical protein
MSRGARRLFACLAFRGRARTIAHVGRGLHTRWSSRPRLAVALLSLCLLMVLSGPAACITHCFLIDSFHQSHRHVGQHGVANAWHALWDDPCAQSHPSTPLPGYAPPSALTIAVIPSLPLLPLLLSVVLPPVKLRPILRDVWPPPPEKPPRCFPRGRSGWRMLATALASRFAA